MLRDDFDLDPGLLYLNAGTQSISPREVTRAVIAHQASTQRNPTQSLIDAFPRLWGVQRKLAAFLGAAPVDLYLRSNVTAALNDFILGVRLPPGGELLVTDLEYGAIVNQCRFRAEREGRAVRTIHLPAQPSNEEEVVDAVVRELRPETRLLLVSHVATGNGLILPVARIARETRARGIVLAIDGAHAPGALPVDLGTLGDADFYGGNLHKWMMGPTGTAFGWVNPRVQDSVEPNAAGWMTYELQFPYTLFGEGSRFAARFALSASADFAPFLALEELLEYWKRRGPAAIRARHAELQARVEAGVSRELGWKSLSPARALRGPLQSFELPPALESEGNALMTRILRESGLQVSVTKLQGRWVLRLSPNIHSSDEEIDRAIGILSRLKPA